MRDNDEDYDENDDDDDDEEEEKDKRNLNYKFTAVYRKDETTGTFEEKSKTVFEAKNIELANPKPLIRPAKPMIPPPPSSSTPEMQVQVQPALSAKSQLASALEALKNNSRNLETKLERLDDITPSPNTYYDSSIQDQSPPEPVNNAQAPSIKMKNDSFFNEFLTKSDDLIAQTQNKLDRLSKLDSVNKPLAPLAQNAAPAPTKPKPTATITTEDTNKSLGSNLVSPSSASINSSKSLIDLKSSDSQIINSNSAVSNQTDLGQNSQVDALFDLNSGQSFTLNSEPIKQGESYFDLIGLSSNEPAYVETTQNYSLNSDLLNLDDINYEQDSTSFASPYQDNYLDLIISEPLNGNQNERKNEPVLQNRQNIDILISEPTNERDDSNVVPEGYFNIKHEIPYDQSRPHSPVWQDEENSQEEQLEQTKKLADQLELTFSSKNVKTSTQLDSKYGANSPQTIARSRPVSPSNRSPRPASPMDFVKSRPSSPITMKQASIPELESEPKLEEVEKRSF